MSPRPAILFVFLAAFLFVAGPARPARPMPLPVEPSPVVRAFPGAEGFGASSRGGRGGKVFEVTTLDDSGPGSLRACLEASGPRTCVFRTGGTIEVRSPLHIGHPYLTIAGQTAPGGGITLRNAPGATFQSTVYVETHDVVIRYLTIRRGPGGEGDCLEIARQGINQVYNVIIDHCSLSWGVDETLSTWYAAHHCSFQWCIISEALNCSTHSKGCHSMGALIGGYASDEKKTEPGAHDISFHHNLLAHNGGRNPMIRTSGLVDVVNNVVYDPAGTFTYIDLETQMVKVLANYVGNCFESGPATDEKYGIRAVHQAPIGAEIFAEGNVMRYRNGTELTSTAEVVHPDSLRYLVRDRIPAAPVAAVPAAEAYRRVLDDAGSDRGLHGDGSFFLRRDAIDRRVVGEVETTTGRIIDHPSQVGGWLRIDPGTPCLDSDHDGMPDAWERAFGFDPADPSDGPRDADGDGYTNIEEYLNGTNPRAKETEATPGPALAGGNGGESRPAQGAKS